MTESLIQREAINEFIIAECGVMRINSFKTLVGKIWLAAYQCYPSRNPVIEKGCSDTLIFYKGRVYAVEFKTEEGRLSTFQKRFRQWCSHFGIPFICIRSKEEAVQFITNVIKKNE